MNKCVIIISILMLGFSLDACKHTKQKSPIVQESSVSEDSIKYIYEGVLPAADAAGIRYTLTISAPRNSGDGTFVLQQAYLGTGEKDTIFTTTGRRYTHRGDANDINATVWQLKSDNGNEIFNTLSAGVAFTGIAAGFVEEMVFRGVILNALKKRWNMKVAVIVPSMLFGIVHVLGQDFSIGSCLLVIIAGTMVGVMFSMIAIESGSVWNSGIVHAIWNIVIIGGGLAIGEKMDPYSVMTYVLDSKVFAITGGEFGIESSVISLIGYIIVAGIAFIMIKSNRKN